MTLLEAIFLGIVQGITEFLPISSSGHLELAQLFLGMQNLHHYVIFDLVCHLGTLLAIFFMFWSEITKSFTTDRKRFIQIVLGTLPLFPLVLIMKPIKALFNEPQYLGACFLFTALLLYLGIRLARNVGEQHLEKRKWRDSLTIGLFQAVAILPGVSRSGSTISAARVLGWSSQEAITFSFLLAIPAILGGVAIESMQLILKGTASMPEVPTGQYIAGFFTSFGVGYYALYQLRLLASKQKFMYFVWYCLLLGIFTTLYFSIN